MSEPLSQPFVRSFIVAYRKHSIAILAILVSLVSACTSVRQASTGQQPSFGAKQFEQLLQTVARGWNTDDAALAASAFAPDAIYTEPPDRQRYQGRQAIFEFFGGADGRDEWMAMTWHHISFNDETSVGAAEFTFAWPSGQVHGMVSIRVKQGLIANWREYYYEAAEDWAQFTRFNAF